MALMIPDAEGIYTETKPPLIYNHQLEAWQDNEGLAYNQELGAWKKVWPITPTIELLLTDAESFAKLIRHPDSTGSMTWTTSGAAVSIPQNGGTVTYYYALPEQVTFNGDFEFSADIYFETSDSKLGAVDVRLYNGAECVLGTTINDAWAGHSSKSYVAIVRGGDIYNDYCSTAVRNGVFAFRRTGSTISFCHGNTVLKQITDAAPVAFDRIEISAKRDSYYTLNTIYVKNIYAGPPRD